MGLSTPTPMVIAYCLKNLQDLPGPERDETGRVKKRRCQSSQQTGKQRFLDSWPQVDEFRPLLEKKMVPSYGNLKAFCAACDEDLTNHKSTISNHMKSEKHRHRLPLYDEILRQRKTLALYVGFAKQETVAEYEMTICSLIAEKSLAISLVDSLIPALRRLHPND